MKYIQAISPPKIKRYAGQKNKMVYIARNKILNIDINT